MKIRRNGASLLEISASIVLLGMLTTIVAQAFEWTKGERLESDRREIALAEASNTMEHLVAADWETLVPGADSEIPLSTTSKEMLPGGRLTKEIEIVRDGPAAKRIVVEMRWLNRAGETESPIRLTTWVYPPRTTKESTP